MNSPGAVLTQDLGWSEHHDGRDTMFLAPDAPEISGQLLTSPDMYRGQPVDRGGYAIVYAAEDGTLAVKESTHAHLLSKAERCCHCGLPAIAINASLAVGMERLGNDETQLPNGRRLTMPRYFGALITRRQTRLLMSLEPGSPGKNFYSPGPNGEYTCALSDRVFGTEAARRSIYDRASAQVGLDPASIGYDDDRGPNFVVRNKELVRFDFFAIPS